MQAQAASERGSQADVVHAAEQLQVQDLFTVHQLFKHAFFLKHMYVLRLQALSCVLQHTVLQMRHSTSALWAEAVAAIQLPQCRC